MLFHQRTSFLIVLFLAVATVLATPTVAQTDSDELNTSELKVDAVEPQISLPVVQRRKDGKLRARTISLGRRKESQDSLITLAQEAVETTSRRLLSSDQHTPWQMMHALLGLRQEFNILHQGEEISGLNWIAEGQVHNGDHWFEKTRFGGRAHPYSVPYAFEGHANQMLAVLSMCSLEPDHEFQTASGAITIKDMVEHAKATCDTKKDEPTWTLWALSRYLPPNAVWRNQNGQVCSIELLVADQTKRPLQGAACGGTHGLYALAHARNVYLQEGKPLQGVWLKAENKLRYYINMAKRLQNSDGTLSSNYLRTRQYNPDFNKRMASAGHVLEFLMIALPQNELNQRWVRRAIEATARDLLNNRKEYVKCSPLYHSVNALNIYLDRVNPREDVPQTAKADSTKTAMVQPKERSGRTKARGISQSRTLIDSVTTGPTAKSKKEERHERREQKKKKDSPETVGDDSKAEEAGSSSKPEPAMTEPANAEPDKASDAAASKLSTSHRIDRAVIDAIVQDRLEQLEGQAKSLWTASDDSSSPANKDTSSSSLKQKTEPMTISITKQEPKIGTVRHFRSSTTLTPVSASTSFLASASKSQPTTTNESAGQSADDGTQFEEPKTATRELMVPGRLFTGKTASIETEIQTAVNRAPLSIPVNVIGDSRVLDRSVDAEQSEEKADKQKSPKKVQAMEFPTVPAGINDRFLDPDMNPEDWVNRFEVESREIYACREKIVAAINLKDGQAIADVGAGTGLFTELFSKAAGPKGIVYAIDISPRLVAHLEERVANESLSNVTVVRNDATSTQLVTQKVDKAFICDTYHHFERPDSMMKSIHRSLNKGGELVLIDFERIPGQSREWVMGHVRAGKDTFRDEIEASGFEFVKEVKVDGFKENYLLIFRRK